MKTKIWITGALCAATVATAGAQGISNDAVLGGKLLGVSYFDLTTMKMFSQRNYAYGTARSSAMAGAFTSLGGDLASMGINPAGLGMYRASEFGLSLAVETNSTHESYPGDLWREDYNRTRFVPTNVSLALNLYQGSGALTSFTFGFGYNRRADFNYRSTVGLPHDNYTIGQIFERQLDGIPEADLSRDYSYGDFPTSMWGGILGYKAYMIDPADENDEYDLTTVNPYNPFNPGSGPGVLTDVDHLLQSRTKGSIGEYNISAGMNFNNRVYVGLGIGIQDIYYRQDEIYSEQYVNDKELPNYGGYLYNMYYGQHVKYSGTAIDFKLGIIVRPVGGLRVGVAFHSPSFVSVDQEYGADMQTELNDGRRHFAETNLLSYDYRFSSPPRLLTGISYTFGNVGVISADYERVWYNGMRISDKDGWRDDYKAAAKEIFKGADNVRVGAEFKPLPSLALRAGYAYYGSMLRDDDRVFDGPVGERSYNVSAGIGYRKGIISLDLAYTYMNEKFTSYDLFYYKEPGYEAISQSGYLTPERTRHLVTLSFGARF